MAASSNGTVEIQIPRDLFEELRELASQVDYQVRRAYRTASAHAPGNAP